MSDKDLDAEIERLRYEVARHVEITLSCPACGEDTPTLREVYCEPCRERRQNELDRHNAEFDAWERLSPAERERRIRWGSR